jgi:hypothetical protein
VQGTLENAYLRYILASQEILVGIEAEAPQVKIGPGLDRDVGDPARQQDHDDQQQPPERGTHRPVEWCGLGDDGERQDDECQRQRPFGPRDDPMQKGMALAGSAIE